MKLPLIGRYDENTVPNSGYKEHLTNISDLLSDASKAAVKAAKRLAQ